MAPGMCSLKTKQSSGLLPVQVRTPLNGCLASAEMLLETSLGAEQRELARTIRVSGSILLSTVSNFLDFFKLEAGKPLDVVRREINVQVSSKQGIFVLLCCDVSP